MVLVDDKLYGKCAYVISDADESNRVEFDLIKTFVENVPRERQDKILLAILDHIIDELTPDQ